MRKLIIKILFWISVLTVVMPSLVFAAGFDVKVTDIFFQDEDDNMVYVDYEGAINSSMEEDDILYNAIKYYVGIAEEKGKDVYTKTNTGKLLDYKLAMLDNLFRLKDILGNRKYIFSGRIEYTHQLKVIDGVAVIVPIHTKYPRGSSGSIKPKDFRYPKYPKDSKEPIDIAKIHGVESIAVEIGTSLEELINVLPKTTTILDSKGNIHIVYLDWKVINYDETKLGHYKAIGVFELPKGVKNNKGLELKVETIVEVIDRIVVDWPEEVECVFVGTSEITCNTYANIKIKEEYVSVISKIYVDNKLATQIEDEKSQWRVKVKEGSKVEDLKGKILVILNEEPK